MADIDDYATRSTRRVEMATAAGAEILCFAEYGAFELASLCPGLPPMEQVEAVQRWLPDYRELFRALAVAHGVTIVGPGFIEATDRGLVKRVWVCGRDGSVSVQDKIHLTAWEKRAGLVNGESIGVFLQQVNWSTSQQVDRSEGRLVEASQKSGGRHVDSGMSDSCRESQDRWSPARTNFRSGGLAELLTC